ILATTKQSWKARPRHFGLRYGEDKCVPKSLGTRERQLRSVVAHSPWHSFPIRVIRARHDVARPGEGGSSAVEFRPSDEIVSYGFRKYPPPTLSSTRLPCGTPRRS